ncbi:M20/M25/M40 family metallo-hydrolase [candidate division KSB1 bacterium]
MKKAFLLIIICLIFSGSFAQERDIYKKITAMTGQVSTERLESYIKKLVGFHNRNTFSDTLSETRGIGAARRWIFEEFNRINRETGGRMKIYFDEFIWDVPQRYQRSTGIEKLKMANVVAVIPGKTDRKLVINGHYDSRNTSGIDVEKFAPGANDDLSGTAALFEIARILSKENPVNTIILSANVAEEQGLLGANHMSEEAKAESWKLEGVIANDMISNIKGGDGRSDNTILRCFSPDPAESPSRNFALYVNNISEKYVPDLKLKMIFRLDRFGRGGDHSPFVRQGFAGIRFTEPYENYENQHSPSDTPENMSFEYFTRTTKMNVAIVSYWAYSPESPMIVSVRRDNDYRTQLSFICNEPEENIKGFKVYMRETDSGYWTESMFFPVPEKIENRRFGEAYSVTLDNRDQDYYIFGIASVNKNGYESIVSTYDREKVREKIQGNE